jgi:hypothetical protein
MTKDSGLRIRVQRDLRDSFLDACRAQDKPAAQVIREFMRDYIERHGQALADREGTESKGAGGPDERSHG